MESVSILRILTRIPQVHQQCRFYRPIKLDTRTVQNLDKVRKPFIPDDPDLILEWQKHPAIAKMYKQKAWGSFGSASGVDLASVLPTKNELEEEWKAEKEWWPTLQEMQKNIRKKKEQEIAEKKAYDKKIAANLANMPKWIAQWEEQNKVTRERDEISAGSRKQLIARVMEETNYSMEEHSMDFKIALREEMTKERELKKKAKRLGKQLKGKKAAET